MEMEATDWALCIDQPTQLQDVQSKAAEVTMASFTVTPVLLVKQLVMS